MFVIRCRIWAVTPSVMWSWAWTCPLWLQETECSPLWLMRSLIMLVSHCKSFCNSYTPLCAWCFCLLLFVGFRCELQCSQWSFKVEVQSERCTSTSPGRHEENWTIGENADTMFAHSMVVKGIENQITEVQSKFSKFRTEFYEGVQLVWVHYGLRDYWMSYLNTVEKYPPVTEWNNH